MFGHEFVVALVSDDGDTSQPLSALIVQELDVYDFDATLKFRRARRVDIDGDGLAELCVETVVETGPGLFQLMDMDAAGAKWIPYKRSRRRVVLRRDTTSGRIRRERVDEDRCPAKGYRSLMKEPELPRPMVGRDLFQGDKVRLQPRPSDESD